MSETHLICVYCGKLMDLCECPEPDEPYDGDLYSSGYYNSVNDSMGYSVLSDAEGWS